MANAKINAYELVTQRIIEKMKEGKIPWRQPWVCKEQAVNGKTAELCAFNRMSRLPYSLLNQFMLKNKGEYATFKQWVEMGGKIKKGSKAECVVFWKWLDVEEKLTDTSKDTEGEVVIKKRIPLLKYYQVFHISCVDNVYPLDFSDDIQEENSIEPIPKAEEAISAYLTREHIPLLYGGNKAAYSPALDCIYIPDRHKFGEHTNELYSTEFHEIAHSTGHKSRLNRFTEPQYFGNEAYSKEELIAEISASAILALLGLETQDTFTNSTAYLQGWIRRLSNDNKMFVMASAQADKAIEFILSANKKEMEE